MEKGKKEGEEKGEKEKAGEERRAAGSGLASCILLDTPPLQDFSVANLKATTTVGCSPATWRWW